MAEELQKPKPRKKQQIEPLDWSTMAQSPALKGMVSFLEVTPEEIRRQQGKNGDSRVGVIRIQVAMRIQVASRI